MKPFRATLLAVGFVAMAGGIYYGAHRGQLTSSPAKPSEPRDAEGSESKPQYPVTSDEKPNLKSSSSKEASPSDYEGQNMEDALSVLIGRELFLAVFNQEDLARRIVVAVENATGPDQLPPEKSPVKLLDSDFVVSGQGKQLSISSDNYNRYSRFVELAKTVDPEKLVAIYRHVYPTLQSAYRELGTNKYFNDRVVQVIDHILKTPVVPGNPFLFRPSSKNKYLFKDDSLQNNSSSQKALIRMGYDNANIIKDKLRQIRELLKHLGRKIKS